MASQIHAYDFNCSEDDCKSGMIVDYSASPNAIARDFDAGQLQNSIALAKNSICRVGDGLAFLQRQSTRQGHFCHKLIVFIRKRK